MRYLLHCIFAEQDGATDSGLRLVTTGGLSAAVSCLEESRTALDVSRLLAYERAIAAIHARGAVIPLRYGCVLRDEFAIVRLLRQHRSEYRRLLAEFTGMAEMGVRVLQPGPAEAAPVCSSGRQYLAALRRRLGADEDPMARHIRGWLSGLYAREQADFGGRMLSLYFLVPHAAIEAFRLRARQIPRPASQALLITGPWPPYNFVRDLRWE